MKRPHGLDAARLIGIQQPLDGGPRHGRQFGDPFMRFAVRLQPQHFHPPLDQRVGMRETIPLDFGQHVPRKLESPHPCALDHDHTRRQPPP